MFFFNKSVNFNTENVKNMRNMFNRCKNFYSPINFKNKYCNNIKFIFDKFNKLKHIQSFYNNLCIKYISNILFI